MKRQSPNRRAVAVAVPAPPAASTWLPFLAAAALVAISFALAGALR